MVIGKPHSLGSRLGLRSNRRYTRARSPKQSEMHSLPRSPKRKLRECGWWHVNGPRFDSWEPRTCAIKTWISGFHALRPPTNPTDGRPRIGSRHARRLAQAG
jgi:hypothetical protein